MATDPRSYSYQRRPNAEYKRFSEEYFSGQDVRIYFGDTWVDEIVGLNFQLIENVAPIFGYASYTFDTVARGSRQIQGSFRINFKEAYYLHAITNRMEYELSEQVTATTLSGADPQHKNMPKNNITIDHLLGSIESIYSASDFDALATQFENSLWGESTNSSMQNRTTNRGNESFFYPESARPNLAKDGFSILVLYGPYTQSYVKGATNEKVATTTHSLVGVHLTGVSQIVDNSGQPLYEEYTFIARDLDENVNLIDTSVQYAFGKVLDPNKKN
jgi:hypothetical protein